MPLGSEVVAEIVERTDGVPLFVEELTKAVLEGAGQDNRMAAVLSASPLPALALPATLHASLIARLDRIGAAAKEVAQIGAVLGREFTYEWIEPLAERIVADLQAPLARLTEAGLLFCRGAPPHSSYLFKHALVQDAAYGTLLRARRQELHARAAAVLEKHFPDLVERQPELLARHLTAAVDTERAVNQCLRAGRHAATRSAHAEATGHLGRGLAALSSLPPTLRRDRQEAELLVARGLSRITAEGMTSAEAADDFTRAKDLCEKHDDADRLFIALWNVCMTTALRDISQARPISNRLLVLSANRKDDALRLEAHHTAWFTNFYSGQPAEACRHCDEGRRLYDIEQHRSLALLYGGHDPGVCARQTGAWSEWLLGYPDRALASMDEAIGLAEGLGHLWSLDIAYLYGAALHLFRREPVMVIPLLDAAKRLAAGQRLALLLGVDVLRQGGPARSGLDGRGDRTARRGPYSPNLDRASHVSGLPHGAAGGSTSAGWKPQPRACNSVGCLVNHRYSRRKLVGTRATTAQGHGSLVWRQRHRSRNLLPASDAHRAGAAGEILGTARCYESGAAVGRARSARGGARAAGADLRLVHRRLRYHRSEGREGDPRRAGVGR